MSETLDELRWLNNNINLWNDILRVVKDFEFWRNELNQFKIIEGGKK